MINHTNTWLRSVRWYFITAFGLALLSILTSSFVYFSRKNALAAALENANTDHHVKVSILTDLNMMLTQLIVLNAVFILMIGIGVMIGKRFLKMIDQVNEANRELSRLDAMKDQFLSNVSHELRTPLNGVVGMMEAIMNGAFGPLNRRVSEQMGLVARSAAGLQRMVQGLIDLAQFRDGKMNVDTRPLKVEALLEIIRNVFEDAARAKGLTLTIETGNELPPVQADEYGIQSVLFHLMDNAVKFTAKGGVIISAKHEGKMVEIIIRDTGRGMNAEQVEQIFRPFTQVDGSDTREVSGMGIGLPLSQRWMNKQHGALMIESEPGQGTTVRLQIPVVNEQKTIDSIASSGITSVPNPDASRNQLKARLAQEQMSKVYASIDTGRMMGAAAPATAEDDEPELMYSDDVIESIVNQMSETRLFNHIVLVDDEEMNLMVLESQLRMAGYRTSKFTSGTSFLEWLAKIAEADRPHIILLDIMMPRVSGFDVCRKVREVYTPANLPILMLTAKNQVPDMVHGFESGANDYITKPFSRNELLSRIDLHLQLSEFHCNMEKKVLERTASIRSLLNNAGQGFMMITYDMRIHPEYSSECNRIFKKELAGLSFLELIYPNDKLEQSTLGSILSSMIDTTTTEKRELLEPLLPHEIHFGDIDLQLQYRWIEGVHQQKASIMVILTDITEPLRMRRQIEQDQKKLRMIVSIITHHQAFANLYQSFQRFCQEPWMAQLEESARPVEWIDEYMRGLHTFKGNFAQYHLDSAVHMLHEMEAGLQQLRLKGAVIAEIKQWYADHLPEKALVSDISELKKTLGSLDLLNPQNITIHREMLYRAEHQLAALIDEPLRIEALAQIRKLYYTSIFRLLSGYKDYLQDLAARYGKSIAPLKLRGEDCLINPETIDPLLQSLVHVFRNIVEHAVESFEERLDQRKPERATIQIQISPQHGAVEISISDDGRGIDMTRLRKRAIEAQPARKSEIERMDEQSVMQLIFEDSVSTRQNITELSGRGVGMSAVRAEAKKMGGHVSVQSQSGKGTTITITVPVDWLSV